MNNNDPNVRENSEKPNFGPDFGSFGPQNFFRGFYLLDVRHSPNLSSYSISRKKLKIQTQENGQKRHFGPDLGRLE